MPPLPQYQFELKTALREETKLLTQVDVPIITVSATFRKELIKKYQTLSRGSAEVVFSRAHYSMAEAVRQQAVRSHQTAHLVDPTNFVSHEDWAKVDFTEEVGHLIARHKTLKWLKDQVDTVARSKLPISDAITPPLLYLTDSVSRPIISLHYEAGNIVARNGKPVIQVLTDPHVRPQYLDPLLPSPPPPHYQNTPPAISYAVFDTATKRTLVSLARQLRKTLDPNSVVVTGPPVDPRLTQLGTHLRRFTPGQPLHLGITTGGLGTNLDEIKTLLKQLQPFLNPPGQLRLFLYAGSHRDFRNFFETFAAANSIRIGNLDDETARIRILFEDSILDANENLIRYMFPWAHGIVTKPSGDMAYDAAAAGCFLLFLEPWGEWEENIQRIFQRNGVGHDFKVKKAASHLGYLIRSNALEKSLKKSHLLPPLFRSGAKNLIRLHSRLSQKLA